MIPHLMHSVSIFDKQKTVSQSSQLEWHTSEVGSQTTHQNKCPGFKLIVFRVGSLGIELDLSIQWHVFCLELICNGQGTIEKVNL